MLAVYLHPLPVLLRLLDDNDDDINDDDFGAQARVAGVVKSITYRFTVTRLGRWCEGNPVTNDN